MILIIKTNWVKSWLKSSIAKEKFNDIFSYLIWMNQNLVSVTEINIFIFFCQIRKCQVNDSMINCVEIKQKLRFIMPRMHKKCLYDLHLCIDATIFFLTFNSQYYSDLCGYEYLHHGTAVASSSLTKPRASRYCLCACRACVCVARVCVCL